MTDLLGWTSTRGGCGSIYNLCFFSANNVLVEMKAAVLIDVSDIESFGATVSFKWLNQCESRIKDVMLLWLAG